jgi:hypothetical protein
VPITPNRTNTNQNPKDDAMNDEKYDRDTKNDVADEMRSEKGASNQGNTRWASEKPGGERARWESGRPGGKTDSYASGKPGGKFTER